MLERVYGKESEHYENLVLSFLKYGRISDVYQKEDVFVSPIGYRRLLREWGVVKSPGPNGIFSETLAFLKRLLMERLPLESLYRRMPNDFKTSISSLHRTLSCIKKGIVRLPGEALIVTPERYPDMVLVGEEVFPRLAYGKKVGDISIPMGFAKKGEEVGMSILRILQQEVSNPLVLERSLVVGGNLTKAIIDDKKEPFMFIDIADVRVACHHIVLPGELCEERLLKSGKLNNLRFAHLDELSFIENAKIRAGVKEIVEGHRERIDGSLDPTPFYQLSNLNKELLAIETVPNY